jgi:uncharacterized protein HemY
LLDTLIPNGQSEVAERWVAKALQMYPQDPVVLGLAARAAVDADHIDEAIALAHAALARDERNIHALIARAKSRLARAQWQPALSDVECAVALAPNDAGLLQLLLIIESRSGLAQRVAATRNRLNEVRTRVQAMDELTHQITRRPDDPELPWKLGKLAAESGQTLLASRCFEAALALQPAFQPARRSLMELQASHPELAQSPPRSTRLRAPAVGSLP